MMLTGAVNGMAAGRDEDQKIRLLLLLRFRRMKNAIHYLCASLQCPIFARKRAEHTLALGAKALSDGLACFRGIADAGCVHLPTVTGGGAESMNNEQFKWVHTMLGNVKNSLRGAYHKLDSKHLPRYLAEFNYRFNRRFDLGSMVERLGRVAVRTAPMPERFLKMADIQW